MQVLFCPNKAVQPCAEQRSLSPLPGENSVELFWKHFPGFRRPGSSHEEVAGEMLHWSPSYKIHRISDVPTNILQQQFSQDKSAARQNVQTVRFNNIVLQSFPSHH